MRKNELITEIKRLILGEPDPIVIFYQVPENANLYRCVERPGELLTKKQCGKIRASVHIFIVHKKSGLAKEASEPGSGYYVTTNNG